MVKKALNQRKYLLSFKFVRDPSTCEHAHVQTRNKDLNPWPLQRRCISSTIRIDYTCFYNLIKSLGYYAIMKYRHLAWANAWSPSDMLVRMTSGDHACLWGGQHACVQTMLYKHMHEHWWTIPVQHQSSTYSSNPCSHW
mgnify:CR=1 FL=1